MHWQSARVEFVLVFGDKNHHAVLMVAVFPLDWRLGAMDTDDYTPDAPTQYAFGPMRFSVMSGSEADDV